MTRTLVPPALAGLLAAAALAVAPAGAQEAVPVPTSCAGVTFTDPAGDQELQLAGPTGPIKLGHKPPENTDLLSGFFRYVPDANGNNVLTANLVVSNLDTKVDPGSSGGTWYFYFKVGDATRSVSANLDTAGNWTYVYGTLGGSSGPGNNTDGDTTGKVYPGKEGVISIVVPVNAMGLANKSLTTPYGSSRVAYRTPVGLGLVPTADDGPDDRAGKTFRVTPCAEEGTPTPTGTGDGGGDAGGGGGGDTGGGSGGGGGGGTGTNPPSSGGAAALDLKVTAGKLSAKKIKRKRAIAFKVTAGERISDLAASLKRGGKTVGTGKLASVGPGKGTLKVKIAKAAAKK
ncbi:MAG TPA: hypothetical protein VM266_15875, partial [Solirubrobacteraceae bacterium]|nr:hypothetical protein [Solirubrobacteraceae bacterium]